jgi:hypothetical protein
MPARTRRVERLRVVAVSLKPPSGRVRDGQLARCHHPHQPYSRPAELSSAASAPAPARRAFVDSAGRRNTPRPVPTAVTGSRLWTTRWPPALVCQAFRCARPGHVPRPPSARSPPRSAGGVRWGVPGTGRRGHGGTASHIRGQSALQRQAAPTLRRGPGRPVSLAKFGRIAEPGKKCQRQAG